MSLPLSFTDISQMTEYHSGYAAATVEFGNPSTVCTLFGFRALSSYPLRSVSLVSHFEHHLHYMVLALACFLGGFATNSLIPVTVNYVIECFKNNPSECAAIMGVYRLAFSLTVPFFVEAWIEKLGFDWCLGSAAFSQSSLSALSWYSSGKGMSCVNYHSRH